MEIDDPRLKGAGAPGGSMADSVSAGQVTDITPSHNPVWLAREMLHRAPEAKAGIAILLNDGELWYDMAGFQRRDILWALQRMIHELMEGR